MAKDHTIDEGLGSRVPLLTLDTEDSELVSRIDKAIASGSTLYENTRKRAKQNREYWKANQLDARQLKDYQAKVVNNLIFRDMETMVPIITKNTPMVKFISSAKDFDRSLEKILTNRWEVVDRMLEKNRKAVRANFLDLLGLLKYRFDPEIDDIVWEFVPTDHVIIDPDCTDIEDCGFVAEFIGDQTVKDITERWPNKKKELLNVLGATEEDEIMGTPLRYVEFSTPDFVCWKYKTVVFDKVKNPNWDWGMDQVVDEMGEITAQAYNLWKRPRVPYVFFQTFNLGEMVYSDTSLIEQTLRLQDGINKRKRQISDNADEANGTLVGSGDGISKDEFAKIDDEPNLKVWIEHGRPREGLDRIPGNSLQPYVYQDMVHSESSVDDLWGIHSITRGAPGTGDDTATAKVLQNRQDYGRIDDIVKSYEDFNEQYYQATFQMMLVHYTNEHSYSFEDEDDLVVSREKLIQKYSKAVKQRQSEIEGQVEEEIEGDFRPPTIMVKRGSTLPTDDVSRRTEALELWGSQGISPIDLYKKLDWPDARDAAYRLMLWKADPQALFPDMGGAGATDEFSQGVVQDYEALKNGQMPPPSTEVQNPQTAAAHIEGHNRIMDTTEWQSLDPAIQKAYLEHLKAEIALAKQVLAQQGGASEQAPTGEPVQEI